MSAPWKTTCRRLLVWAVFILTGMILTGWIAWWLLTRKQALQVLREEITYGLTCFRVEPGKDSRFPEDLGWKCYLPWSGPTMVQINYALPRGARLGSALRHFGTLTEIDVGQGEPREIDALFNALGKQKGLRSLFIYDVELDDGFCRFLARYSLLSSMEISPSKISGEQMPLLPQLEYLGLTFAPVSDAGFRHLLSLPSLRKLDLEDSMITIKGIEELLRVARPPESVSIGGTDVYFTAEQAKPILEAYRKKWPEARLDIN